MNWSSRHKSATVVIIAGILAAASVVVYLLVRTEAPQMINPAEVDDTSDGGTSSGGTTASATQAAKEILRATSAARRARTNEEFVRLFNAELDETRKTKPQPGAGGVGTPEFYANARVMLEESAADAQAVERGQREFNVNIIRGRNAAPTEHADCVAVGTDTDWTCSGTLIGANTVITAGHCDEDARKAGKALSRVFIGNDVRSMPPGRVVPVKRVVPHPSFASGGLQNDLAVLLIDPVPDPSVGIARGAEVDVSRSVREVGFGTTSVTGPFSGTRQLLDVPIASSSCAPTAPTTYRCNMNLELVAKPATTPPAGVCYGDSGGPAYVRAGGGWRIAGVTSRPAAGVSMRCGGAAIFVRLDRYEPWIRSIPGAVLHP